MRDTTAALTAAACLAMLTGACSAGTTPRAAQTSPSGVAAAPAGSAPPAATSRCAPEVLRAPDRRSPAVDPRALYDGVLDYTPFPSLPRLVEGHELTVLGEVSGWRSAAPGRVDGPAVLTIEVVRAYRAEGEPTTVDVRIDRSHRFAPSGGRRIPMTLADKRAALPAGTCVIAVGSSPDDLDPAPQGLVVERPDGSFTGARVDRRDFPGWVAAGTPRADEFAALVAQLERRASLGG